MRVSDLLRAGGGLQDAAYGAKAELTRYRMTRRRAPDAALEVDLAAILKGDASADLLLQPFDFLNVKEVPEWSEQEQVTLLGEVRFPGIYPIQRGETLRSVLDRAGGLTALAFPRRLGLHARRVAGARAGTARSARGTTAERSGGGRVAGGGRQPGPGRPGAGGRPVVAEPAQGDQGRRPTGHRSRSRDGSKRARVRRRHVLREGDRLHHPEA